MVESLLMTLLLRKVLLLLWVSASLCLGLTGCSSGPTFYDEAAPLTPPPFSPPPLKALDAPFSSEPLNTTESSESLAEDTEQDVSTTSAAKTPVSSSIAPPVSGPLSSPLASSKASPKKSSPSSVTPTNGSLKKP